MEKTSFQYETYIYKNLVLSLFCYRCVTVTSVWHLISTVTREDPYSMGNQSPQSSLTFSMSLWQRKRSWTSLSAVGGTTSLIHTCAERDREQAAAVSPCESMNFYLHFEGKDQVGPERRGGSLKWQTDGVIASVLAFKRSRIHRECAIPQSAYNTVLDEY